VATRFLKEPSCELSPEGFFMPSHRHAELRLAPSRRHREILRCALDDKQGNIQGDEQVHAQLRKEGNSSQWK
jgi:hypothetical protein